MEKDLRAIEILNREYPYGFVTDIDEDSVPAGLSEGIIRLISGKKHEPEWHAGVAFASLPSLVDDERAHVGKHPLSAYRLPGNPLLLRPQNGEFAERSLGESIRSFCGHMKSLVFR